jgi:Zn-dependent protease with chaperone function
MIVSYALRLVCLSLTVFLLVHLTLGILVGLAAPAAIRAAERLRPRTAARLLLSLRLAPTAAALLVVAIFCIPSYLWLEPDAEVEAVGTLCLTAAACAAAIWSATATNLTRAVWRSARFTRQCRHTDAPVLMLAGIFRPQVVVSSTVLDVLKPDQLAAAMRHEEAHRRAHDNLKRLLLAATPGWGFHSLERAWARISELAADDESVAGNLRHSLSLAGALVAMARLGYGHQSALSVSFCGETADLAYRVDRLLHPPAAPPESSKALSMATLAAVVSLAALMVQPRTLEFAHEVFEHLVR